MSDTAEIDRLVAAQEILTEELSSIRGVNSIGIGAGLRPGSYALYVTVADHKTAALVRQRVPDSEIIVDVVGKIRPLSARAAI